MEVAKILAMSRQNRDNDRLVAALSQEVAELHVKLREANERIRGANVIRLIAARHYIPQEAVLAEFEEWLDSREFARFSRKEVS